MCTILPKNAKHFNEIPTKNKMYDRKIKLKGKMMLLFCYLIAYYSEGQWHVLLAHKAKSWARGTPSPLAGWNGALPHPKATSSRALELGPKPEHVVYLWAWTLKVSGDLAQRSSLLFEKGISFEHPRWPLKMKFYVASLRKCSSANTVAELLSSSPASSRGQAALSSCHDSLLS